MDTKANMTVRFRAALKREIPAWVRQGVLTEEQSQRLSERYRLDELERESSHLLAAVIFTIGGLLLGGGVIAFVAANWEVIPVPGKVTLLFAALLAFHGAGYWLWHERGWRRLGRALIFCGCFVFGANIGLLAQIFHIRSEWYRGFAAWAVGVLAVAWAVQSAVIGLLVLVVSFTWFVGFVIHHEQAASLYPFLLAAGLLPLAFVTRARALHVLTLLGILIATSVVTGANAESSAAVLLSIAIGGFLAWAVGEFHRVTGIAEAFGTASAVLGVVTLSVASYVWSFHEMAEELNRGEIESWVWLFPVGAAAVIGVILLARAWMKSPPTGARRIFISGVPLTTVILCGAAILGRAADRGMNEILLTVGVNLAALVLAAVAIASGLSEERRSHFWLGTLFVVLLVLSRFLEYETSLLLKAAAFAACGATVLFAGIRYERYLRRKETAHE